MLILNRLLINFNLRLANIKIINSVSIGTLLFDTLSIGTLLFDTLFFEQKSVEKTVLKIYNAETQMVKEADIGFMI